MFAGVSCVVVVSHVDELCERVAESPANVYHSANVRDCLLNIHNSDMHVSYTFSTSHQALLKTGLRILLLM